MKFDIPAQVLFILQELNRNGYEAYIVGGCVRDTLLGRTPHDYDICTSATPDEIIKSFPYEKIIPTGLKHGTVTIVINGEPFEVTTYRIDGKYSDNRRPDKVEFTINLIEDLRRRDFTINAMAYNPFVGLVDPFNGQTDLKDKKIRCVGNPYERFNEDGLRIMRAVRFSAQLRFEIESCTRQAMEELVDNLDNISYERINSELCKIMNSDCAYLMFVHKYILCKIIPEFEKCIDYNQNNPYHIYTLHKHIGVALIEAISPDLIINLSILFHDIGKPHCCTTGKDGYSHFKGHGSISADMTEIIMKRLKFDNDTIKKVKELVFYHDVVFTVEKKCVKRWLNKLGEEQLRRLLKIRVADIKAQNLKYEHERIQKVSNIQMILDEVLQEKECFTLKDLSINGRDLIQYGIPEGKQIGIILNTLLTMVIDGEIKNEKENLLQIVKLLNFNKN